MVNFRFANKAVNIFSVWWGEVDLKLFKCGGNENAVALAKRLIESKILRPEPFLGIPKTTAKVIISNYQLWTPLLKSDDRMLSSW